MKRVVKKVELLQLVTLVRALQDLPCYENALSSERMRLCRSCSDLAIDAVSKFAILILGGDRAAEPPPHDELEELEQQELPF